MSETKKHAFSTDEDAWETYRQSPPTNADIEGSALKNAYFAGLKRGREMHLPPIEGDGALNEREYIPLPGGWEIQTKGGGSTFRIANKERQYPIFDGGHAHAALTQMARDIRKALGATTTLDEENAIKFGHASHAKIQETNYKVKITNNIAIGEQTKGSEQKYRTVRLPFGDWEIRGHASEYLDRCFVHFNMCDWTGAKECFEFNIKELAPNTVVPLEDIETAITSVPVSVQPETIYAKQSTAPTVDLTDCTSVEQTIRGAKRDFARTRGFTGDTCTNCFNMAVVRNGTCLLCTTCGHTTGCS